jgi:hypothetical protein
MIPAVEWLVEQLSNYDSKMIELFTKEIEQAKQMNMEQSAYFFECGRQYFGDGTFAEVYNETFKTD